MIDAKRWRVNPRNHKIHTYTQTHTHTHTQDTQTPLHPTHTHTHTHCPTLLYSRQEPRGSWPCARDGFCGRLWLNNCLRKRRSFLVSAGLLLLLLSLFLLPLLLPLLLGEVNRRILFNKPVSQWSHDVSRVWWHFSAKKNEEAVWWRKWRSVLVWWVGGRGNKCRGGEERLLLDCLCETIREKTIKCC